MGKPCQIYVNYVVMHTTTPCWSLLAHIDSIVLAYLNGIAYIDTVTSIGESLKMRCAALDYTIERLIS